MDFKSISEIDDDFLRNEELYKFFDEEKRLLSKSGQVEKITTLREIRRLINKDSKVLDVGAATGVYAIPLSSEVEEVVAYEPSTNNYNQLLKKIEEGELTNIVAENKSSLDLGELKDNYFDLVLLFGPMYHLSSKEDRDYTLSQAKRVVKDGGYILIAFINHDMIPMTEIENDPNYLESAGYDAKNQRFINRPFIFFTLSECIQMIEEHGLHIEKKIGSSGFSELLQSKINQMGEISYMRYLEWHLSHCDKEELIGASNHYLFVCRK